MPTHARLGDRLPFSPIAQPVFSPRGSNNVRMRDADDDDDEDLENRPPIRRARGPRASLTLSTPRSNPSDQTFSSLGTSVGSAGQLAARRQVVAGSGSDGGTETAGSRSSGSGTSSDKRKIEALNSKLAEYEIEIKRMKTDREEIKRDADKRVAAAEKRAEAARAKLHNERCRVLKIRVSAYRARKALEHIHMRRPDGSIVRAEKVTVSANGKRRP